MQTKSLKHYPLSILTVLAVCYLSLCPVPETELQDVPFIDKWVHIVMYFGITLIPGIEYLRIRSHHKSWRLAVTLALSMTALSGVLELLQEYATATRSGDWMDLLANAIGATLGAWVCTHLVPRKIWQGKRRS